MEKLWVKSGGRLHLGQLDLNGSLGRLYGGLGLAVNEPSLEVTAEQSDSLSLECQDRQAERLNCIVSSYLSYFGLPGAKVELVQSLPGHSGLGSGTCLSLAVGFAITRVYGLQPSIAELATVTDREGSRSGIGVAAFEHGGFIVDGGRKVERTCGDNRTQTPPLISRIPFPEDWKIILALPNSKRIFGKGEECAFRSLPLMDREVSGAICRLLLMKLLPSLAEQDLQSFGQAVSAIQQHVGTYFAPLQGGLYASDECVRCVGYFRSEGLVGVGQSSWGPTIYGFTRRENHLDLLERIRSHVGDRACVWATSGRNQGASWGRR